MAGTKAGGVKAAATNKAKYGEDYYANVGRKGGLAPKKAPGGFGSKQVGKDGLTGPERAKVVGFIGGRKSRRGLSGAVLKAE